MRAARESLPPSTTSASRAGTRSPCPASPSRLGALGEPRYLEAARVGARFLLALARGEDGVLTRTWKEGEARIPAFLEDEAFLALALLDLADAEGPGAGGIWHEEAKAAVESLRARFRRKDGPGFTFSGTGHEALLSNGRDLFDKAVPSASGAAARALARLALVTGDRALAREAKDAVDEVGGLMTRSPHGMESWFFALELLFEFEDRFGEEERGRFLRVGREERGTRRPGSPVHVEGVAVEPRVVRGEKGASACASRSLPAGTCRGPTAYVSRRRQAPGNSPSKKSPSPRPRACPTRSATTRRAGREPSKQISRSPSPETRRRGRRT